jgi:hypothetical protein
MLSRDEFSGENLFYGIRLSDIICAIPDDDKLPHRVAEPKRCCQNKRVGVGIGSKS